MCPLVSIIIPCHNAERWVGTAIESCLRQTWARCEIVVVDDGSTDGSQSVCRSYRSDRVKVLRQPRRGASAARNVALRLYTGDYVQYLDADDLLAPDKLEQQLSETNDDDSSVLRTSVWGRFHANPEGAGLEGNSLCGDFYPEDFLVRKFETAEMMASSAWLMPRAIAEAAGPWNEQLTLDDDGEYFSRVVLASRRIRYFPRSRSYCGIVNGGSLSRSNSEKSWESQFVSVNLAVDHLLEKFDTPRTRRASANALHRCAFDAYPACPEQYRRTLARVAELGGSEVAFRRGPLFGIVARCIGWKAAKRLRVAFGRVNYLFDPDWRSDRARHNDAKKRCRSCP
jgi:glycosyltransferase involved in cell wall biosynthesis